MVASNRVADILQPHFKNHSPIVEAFSISTGTEQELKINLYYIVCALCIYSRCSWIGKLRCKCYIVIFNLFIKHEADSIALEQLEKLVRSSIKGISIMTGATFPDESLYNFLASQILEFAARKSINRLHMDEFTNLIHSNPEIMSLLEVLKPSTSPKFDLSRRNSLKSSQQPFSRSLNRTKTVSGMLLTHKLPSLTLPLVQSPRMNRAKSRGEKVNVDGFNFVNKFKKQIYANGECYVDLAQHLQSQNVGDVILPTVKNFPHEILSLNEAAHEFTPYHEQPHEKSKKTSQHAVTHQELEIFAKMYSLGDVDGLGWDKSDVYEMLGKRSPDLAYFIIHKFNVSSSNRLKFSDYFRMSLHKNKVFDDEQANEFYSNYRVHSNI